MSDSPDTPRPIDRTDDPTTKRAANPRRDDAGSPDDGKDEPGRGPGSLDWWTDDGPDSPIAADIEEPEKHL